MASALTRFQQEAGMARSTTCWMSVLEIVFMLLAGHRWHDRWEHAHQNVRRPHPACPGGSDRLVSLPAVAHPAFFTR